MTRLEREMLARIKERLGWIPLRLKNSRRLCRCLRASRKVMKRSVRRQKEPSGRFCRS